MTTINDVKEVFENIKPLNFGRRLVFKRYCENLVENGEIKQEEVSDYTSNKFLYDDYTYMLNNYKEEVERVNKKFDDYIIDHKDFNSLREKELKETMDYFNNYKEEVERVNKKFDDYIIDHKDFNSLREKELKRMMDMLHNNIKFMEEEKERNIHKKDLEMGMIIGAEAFKNKFNKLLNVCGNLTVVYLSYKVVKYIFF